MTPEECVQAAQVEASAPQPDHIGHGGLTEAGKNPFQVVPDQPWAAYGQPTLEEYIGQAMRERDGLTVQQAAAEYMTKGGRWPGYPGRFRPQLAADEPGGGVMGATVKITPRVTAQVARRLRLAASVGARSMSAVVNEVLDTALPSLEEIRMQLASPVVVAERTGDEREA
jgi:hypothetical protein